MLGGFRPSFARLQSRRVELYLTFVGSALVALGWVYDRPWLFGGGLVAVLAAWLIPAGARRVVAARRCETCVAFDLAQGQKVLGQAKHFPSWFLSPDQVGVSRQEWEERAQGADGAPNVLPSALTKKKLKGRVHTWDQYGACGEHNEMRNSFDCCDQYRRR